MDLYIDSEKKLAELLEGISVEPLLAIDTEFVREKTYYPKLCLIQIATPNLTACVDCLAEIDLRKFFDELFRQDCAWILHSARQDMEVIYLQDTRMPNRLIDTQTAAALLGHAPQIGLQALLDDEIGVELKKGHARTDWSRRPLPEAAVEYALDDVRYLLPLWHSLEERLGKLQREDWLRADCLAALSIPPVTPPLALWGRLRGLRSLQSQQQAAALAMVAWRERQAQARNRPRRWIMSDEVLMRIAKNLPADLETLKAIPEMPWRLADHSGKEILAALSENENSEQDELLEAHLPPEPPDKKLLRSLQEQVRVRAEALGIQGEVLATRKEIADLLMGRPSERIDGGWRHDELKPILASA
ncbi:MAG: ribonuclease D [Candidatus Rariloculaceae bacterium]